MYKIPKNLFQIYHDKSLINPIVKKEIITLNPKYKYGLYDFEEGISFIKMNFEKKLGIKIINYIENLNRYAHKSDLLRYCLLYVFGGVYLDIDLKQKLPLDEIIKLSNNSELISSFGLAGNITRMSEKEFKNNNEKYNPIISNGFLFSIPKNPILLKMIKKIITLPFKNRHAVNIYYLHDYLKVNNKNNLFAFQNMVIEKINVYLFKEITMEKGGKNAFINNEKKILMFSNNYWNKKEYLNKPN